MSAIPTPFDNIANGGASAPPASSQAVATPFDNIPVTPPAPGQVTNDVGQQVVVPKDGESYSDTINRAVNLTKQRQQNGTQQQAIDAETQTIPAKAAQTVAAAPLIGAGLPAIEGLAPEAVSAAKTLLQAHPVAAKVLGKMLVTGAIGGDVGHSAKTAILGALLGGFL